MQEKDSFKKSVTILGNCIFFPLIIMILLSAVFMYIAKSNKQLPSLFGYSVVTVLSGSMEPDFKVGDTVIVKATPISMLKEGDVIAFYEYQQPGASVGELTHNAEFLEDINVGTGNIDASLMGFLGGGARNDYQKNVSQISHVVFHKIIDISTITDKSSPYCGKIFFYTSGNTQESTKAWIMEDYVVGKYQESSGLIGLVLSMASSPVGSVFLILIPVICVLGGVALSSLKNIKKAVKETNNGQEVQQEENPEQTEDISKEESLEKTDIQAIPIEEKEEDK